MKVSEIITEGLQHKIICVDVQPTYAYYGNNAGICENIINFVYKQTGPVLMYVNAEDQGMSDDTVADIKLYWDTVIAESNGEDMYDDNVQHAMDWDRVTLVDKGYGYFRSWKDIGVSDAGIIKTIRKLYQDKISDSRMLFGGEDSSSYEMSLQEFLGSDYSDSLISDPLTVNWTSVAQLKSFNGAYLVGGGRDECLWEVAILMNAFNIRYKKVNSLIY